MSPQGESMSEWKPTLHLYCEHLEFNRATIDKPSKALVLSWHAETEVQNILLLRVVTLRLRWPLVRVVTCFIDRRDYERQTT
jgi:hypothetical protein